MQDSIWFPAVFFSVLGASIAVPVWWVFHRMDERPVVQPYVPTVVASFTAPDIERIESGLGVVLPADMASFYMSSRFPATYDDSLLPTPDLIVSVTQEYREGFSTVPPWPAHFVYLGDESDACPYALDCATGSVTYTHKGYLSTQPIAHYPTVAEFLNNKFPVRPASGEA